MNEAGVILAGGKATRLGPLAAQLSKALVPVEQRPLIIHQVNALRAMGIDRVAVVVSPSSLTQVQHALSCMLQLGMDIAFVVQERADGPAAATNLGCAAVTDFWPDARRVVMLLADTLLTDWSVLEKPGEWVLTAPAPDERRWCVPTRNGYEEKVVPVNREVCIGAYAFDPRKMVNATEITLWDSGAQEQEMGSALTEYGGLGSMHVDGWLDFGDLHSIASARRELFNARPQHSVVLDPVGHVVKSLRGTDEENRFAWQASFLRDLPEETKILFPRLLEATSKNITTELIDAPTVAELLLYWPREPSVWQHIMESVIENLQRLWRYGICDDIQTRARAMYVDKPATRLSEYPPARRDVLIANGQEKLAGDALLEALEPLVHKHCVTPAFSGLVHGDPNFTNVFYSLLAGTVRFIDPRGSWAASDGVGDTAYDLAKLRYSYEPGFAAICHGLFNLEWDGEDEKARLEVPYLERDVVRAMDEVLLTYVSPAQLDLIVTTLLLSAPPLHSKEEGMALYLMGVHEGNAALERWA